MALKDDILCLMRSTPCGCFLTKALERVIYSTHSIYIYHYCYIFLVISFQELILIKVYQNLQSRFGIERYAYTESHIGQIPCVCMYVCMWSNSSQTTEPICIKIIPANRAFYADCYKLLRFEIFTKYDEYFVIERTPFLNRRSFATAPQRR